MLAGRSLAGKVRQQLAGYIIRAEVLPYLTRRGLTSTTSPVGIGISPNCRSSSNNDAGPQAAETSLAAKFFLRQLWSARPLLQFSTAIETGSHFRDDDIDPEDVDPEERGGVAPTEPLFTPSTLTELTEGDIGYYFEFDAATVPEAFADYHQDPLLQSEGIRVKGGCKGLEEEFDASGETCLLYRSCTHQLLDVLRESLNKPMKSRLLDGAAGSGKSVALATAVSWAREQGWLVCYMPSAAEAMRGGTFFQNEEDGLWDTPESARKILAAVLDVHGDLIKGLISPEASGLHASMSAAVESQDPHQTVKAAVDFIQLLPQLTEVPTLLAIDDYNALYSYTGYGRWVSEHKRVRLSTEELRLASALQVLHKDRAPAYDGPDSDTWLQRIHNRPRGWQGHIALCATTAGQGISPKLLLHRGRTHSKVLHIPRFDEGEVNAMLDYYESLGVEAGPAPEFRMKEGDGVALHWTGGNARELRKYYHMLN